jgi:hypothetical protein
VSSSVRLEPDRPRIQAQEERGAKPESASQVLLVVSGQAWLSLDGTDLVLGRGEAIRLRPRGGKVVISSLGSQPLVCEIV